MKKRALIFGVGGFVGAYLAREFYGHGYEVYGSDLQPTPTIPPFVTFIAGDLLDAQGVGQTIVDVAPTHIANLAAISSVGLSWEIPQKTVAVNVEGSLNILEGVKCCQTMPKVLLIGSSEEYAPCNHPIDEQWEINANNPYGLSKMMQEKFVELYRARYDMQIYHVRSFNHTGPEQAGTFVIPDWCKQAAAIEKSGMVGVISVGNLDVYRDISDVRDVVRAYRMVIESENCKDVYNIGSGQALSLREILSYITSRCRQPIRIEVDQARLRPSDNPIICCDNTKIRTKLGWKTEWSVLDTIDGMMTVYQGEGE